MGEERSKIKNPLQLSPALYGNGYKIMGIVLFSLLWLCTESGLTGLFLILILSILILLRWRFDGFHWTLLLDQFISITGAFFWPEGGVALALSTFEATMVGKAYLALPALLFALFYQRDPVLSLLLVENLLLGLILWNWQEERAIAFFRLDVIDKKRLEMESLTADLLEANVQVAKGAELLERSRIAREIHDQAGHEIVAAYISLQTAEQLWVADPVQAHDLFKEALPRLEKGIAQIRAAVHNLSPLTELGVERLQKLCASFTFCPVDFRVYGDTSKVPIYLWSILEPCLKEALTNIIRHAQAQQVVVALDITPHIVRLCVENDGVAEKTVSADGLGLRNLRQRAKAVGGNISTDTTDGFRLICVLPME